MFHRGFVAASLLLATLSSPAFAQTSAYPDGYVIWQSNRQDSRNEAYRARADGSEVTRLTWTGVALPAWAPDGRWISYMDPSNTIYIMRPDGSDLQVVTVAWQVGWLHDNSGLLVIEGSDYNVYDPETGESTHIFSQGEFPQFNGITFQVNSMTHDNRYVLLGSHLYINGYTGANGSFTSEYSAVILDLLHKDKIYFLGSGCWPFTPPLGDLVFHICANCPTHPDIYHMHLADLDTRASYAPEVAHADADWGHEYNPRVSNDNRWVAYMASAGCHEGDGCDYDIWLHELGTDPSQRLRVTQDPSFDGYPQLFVGPLWQPSAQPRLLVTPNRLTFHASAAALPPAQILKLKNTGGGTLGPATVASDPAVGWLDVVQGASNVTVGLRAGAVLTRGTQCTNLTITVPGAVGSPVTIPVTLVADDTFPYPEAGAIDTGAAWEAGAEGAAEIGLSVDAAGLDDASVCVDVPAARDAGPGIVADATGLECADLAGAGRDAPPGPVDAAPAVPGGTGGGGCGCALEGAVAPAGPLTFLVLGLGIVRARRRSRRA